MGPHDGSRNERHVTRGDSAPARRRSMTRQLVIAGIGEGLWDVYPDVARFGGAPANFACHAAALGADSWMASAVGVDDFGRRALATLETAGVQCEAVARDR